MVVSANGTKLYTIPTSDLNETIPCYIDTRIKLDGTCFVQSGYDVARDFAYPICLFVMVVTGILMVGTMVVMIVTVVLSGKDRRESSTHASKTLSTQSPVQKKSRKSQK